MNNCRRQFLASTTIESESPIKITDLKYIIPKPNKVNKFNRI